MSTFVFFHVGDDLEWPTRMVASLRAFNPGAEIIQVTDRVTATVEGVTWAYPTEGDREFLMHWRLAAFARLGLDEPALYLDTDMVVKAPIKPSTLVLDEVCVPCRRSFNRDALFNPRQRGLDFSEYTGKTLDEVYPFVGCATVTRDAGPWEDMAEMFEALPEKFWRWYGDQEVLREYCRQTEVTLPEYHFACLPEYLKQYPDPAIVHYKGVRKALMPTVTAPA
jgi:hypothetical protein